MAKEHKNLITGLDIGTAKVMAVTCEVQPDGQLRLVGLGTAASKGIKRGVVVDIEATVGSIDQAIKEAEQTAGCNISRVHTGLTGSHIRSLNTSGMVMVKGKEVTVQDVARAVDSAKTVNTAADQRLLLVEPQEFIIDGNLVREPVGMSGKRLQTRAHIVTGAQSAAENVLKCVRRCGLEVDQIMLNPLASGLAVLTDDERELGAVCVDIGAGTTDVSIFFGGAIRHTAVIPIAGELMTSDIAIGLHTTMENAEHTKVEHGVAKQMLAPREVDVDVSGMGEQDLRQISKQALAGVIEPRVVEIFSLVQQVIHESGLEEQMQSAGIVLTGGSASMPGMVDLGEDIFLKPVRVAVPRRAQEMSDMLAHPRVATVMGLLEEARLARIRGFKAAEAGGIKLMFSRIRDFFIGNL